MSRDLLAIEGGPVLLTSPALQFRVMEAASGANVQPGQPVKREYPRLRGRRWQNSVKTCKADFGVIDILLTHVVRAPSLRLGRLDLLALSVVSVDVL